MKTAMITLALVFATGASHAQACKLSREPEPWPKTSDDGGLMLPFESLGHDVVVFFDRARCSVRGKNRFTLHVWKRNRSYDIDCAIESPRYESTTPVRLVEDFKPGKEDRRQKRRWGVEFTKSDGRFGTTFTTYLCPDGAEACVEIIHGGIEFLRFDLRRSR